MYMKLNLTVDCMSTLRWWVDASYGVYADSKGHMGMMMSMGKGATMSGSLKQKLNGHSSTEAELIGIDDALPNIIWAYYFIKAQGYDVTHNIMYQDNKSTILLATNGRMSASKRMKHIHHRFFLVKDKIDHGELEVEYKPTREMWSDVLTKPLQGKAFHVMRGMLMNVPEEYNDEAERKNTHPGLLPKEEESPVARSEQDAVLKEAVSMVSAGALTKRAVQPSGHHRSVLSRVHGSRGSAKVSSKVSLRPDTFLRFRKAWDEYQRYLGYQRVHEECV